MDSLRLMDTVALGSSIVGSSGVALASSSVAALSARSLPQPAADSNHNLSPTKNSHLFNTHHYQLTGASCFVLHDNSSPPRPIRRPPIPYRGGCATTGR